MQYAVTYPFPESARTAAAGAVLAALGLLAATTAASPQQHSASTPVAARSRDAAPMAAFAVRAEPGSPTLDGKLDDPVWLEALAISGFTQVRPDDGTDPTERTEVFITYDDAALYIGARMHDGDPAGIVGRLGRRDGFTPSDFFSVEIDSYHDHRTAFSFTVNPAGVRSDEVMTNDGPHGDMSWDPVWEAATRIDSLGWVAELRIPFSQLRFSSATEQVWGINFSRSIFRKNEYVRWSWAPNTEQGFASLFGHLQGLRGIPASSRLELLPYTVAKSDFTEGADRANPFDDGSVQDLTGGLDLKYGLTSDITLDATFNPDFGQVEADPAVVNLSAFETYFQERRPFFVEGANIFKFGAGSGGFVYGAPQLFYSRRVGRQPSEPADEPDGYVDNPTATRILGATKLSGKTGSWSIGLLDALTAPARARVQLEDGTRETRPVEPLANYAVASVRRDFRDGATGVGALATAVHRNISNEIFSSLRSSAYSGGADFFHKFANNQFAVNGTISASHIRGDPAAITDAQRSSARYFQRPDQDYVSVDSSATSMTGFAASMQFDKVSGNWVYGTDLFAYSPHFEVNDAGFQTGVDRIFHGIRLTRRWLQPGKVFRNFRINGTFAQQWNFGGVNLFRSPYLGIGGQFRNYWSFSIGGSYDFTGLSDKTTRGGPLMENPSGWSANGFVATDHRKPVSLAVFGYYTRNRYDGWAGDIGSEVNIRPTGAVNLSLSPSFSKSHAMGFYVSKSEDTTAIATFGVRYLFSELAQTSLDMTLRMDVALTPDLSIQLYAQPFIAAGDYSGFKELAKPRTFNFLRYGTDNGSTISFDAESNEYTADPDGDGVAEPITFENPDFRFRSLRSNLVVRWEYKPGSTVFLVWNHGRSASSDDPTFGVFDEVGNLFADEMTNTFLVKFNYWLSF